MRTKPRPERLLDWTDCIGLIAGIMLGTGIFAVFPKLAAEHNPSVSMILLAWGAGTLIALCGAFCFAELAVRFPHNGGEYVFLKEAFGRDGRSLLSFLFAWAQIFVIRPGSLVSLSIILAVNAEIMMRRWLWVGGNVALPGAEGAVVSVITVGTLVVFTAAAMAGVKASKWIQNLFTLLKVGCLAVLVGMGIYLGRGMEANLVPWGLPEGVSPAGAIKNLGVALIPVMWVFGGWNEAPYIAADMKDPARNIPRALIGGVAGLGLLYLLINFVYVLHLTPAGLASSWTFASDLMRTWFGPAGETVMATVLVLSTAGAISGLTVTGAHMTAAFAQDLRVLPEGQDDHVVPLLLNLAVSLAMAWLVDCAPEGIDRLMVFTSGVVWLFFGLVASTVIVFRRRPGQQEPGYRLPLYPFTPLVFIATCGYMLYGAWEYKPMETIYGLAALLTGVPAYLSMFRVWGNMRRREAT